MGIRIYGRSDDWSSWELCRVTDSEVWRAITLFGPDRFYLGITLTLAQASQLLRSDHPAATVNRVIVRGHTVHAGGNDLVRVENIEITAAEASRISNGEHPRDVLLFPECGYRMAILPDPLVTGPRG